MQSTKKKQRFSFAALEWDRIIAVLDETAVSDGCREKIASLEPYGDREVVEYLLTVHDEARLLILRGHAYPLYGFADIDPALKSLGIPGAVLTVDEINAAVSNLGIANDFLTAFHGDAADYPELTKVVRKLFNSEKLVINIRKKVDEEGTIPDSATPELKRIRKNIRQKQDRLKDRIDELMKLHAGKGHLQENHVTLRGGRYVLPVKDSHIRHVKGITHDISSTGSTSFIEPIEIVDRNNEIARLFREEQEEVARIIRDVTEQLRGILDDLRRNQRILTDLDFHYVCGKLAYRLQALKPKIVATNRLYLRQARHPLLLLRADSPEKVVPLDVTLGGEYDTVVISGPNAGGKTVALKTVGLLCLMVQCGLPVPASDESEFPVFSRIIAEIGDPQSIEDDLSTFSARLVNVNAILDGLSERDLILLDELGTGTDPQEGVAIAISIIEHLTNAGAHTIVTTHHGGLKLFANETERIENASLAFDEATLTPTYRLTVGIPGSSYALELAERIGLPKEIIENTRTRIGGEQLKVEHFIRELESRTAELKERQAAAAQRQTKLDALIADYEEKLAAVKKEYADKLEKETTLSEERLREFNKRFERLVKEIREQGASRESILKVKETVRQEENRIKNVRTKQKKLEKPANQRKKAAEPDLPAAPVEIGGTVRIAGFDQTGTIVAENLRKQTVTVQMASARMEVPRANVVGVKHTPKQTVKLSGSVPHVQVQPEVDVRGMAADDALEAVDQYLMDALALGYAEVGIIHGKGTGVLRRVVADFLKRDSRVADSRLGNYGEGDTGVTFVKLKN